MKLSPVTFAGVFFSLIFAFPASAEVKRIWLTHQSPDPSKIVVSWQTEEPGPSLVEFGTSAALGETVSVEGSRTLHHVEIPLAQKEVVYHYRVKTGAQESDVATFKGYPTKELRIGVVANLRADAKIDLSDQSCHPFGADSGQIAWYRETMEATKAGQVITLFGETGSRVRSHAGGEWKRLIAGGTMAISGEAYHAERTLVEGIPYFNTSVRGNGTFGIDPDHDFINPSGGYLLITLDKATGAMKVAIKALDGRVLEEQTVGKKTR